MACADAGSGDLHTREFSEWSKVEFAQHWGSCQTLRNVDGDHQCDVQICGVGQEPAPERHYCLLDLYHDRPRARYGLRMMLVPGCEGIGLLTAGLERVGTMRWVEPANFIDHARWAEFV